jgi:hypothetical protein
MRPHFDTLSFLPFAARQGDSPDDPGKLWLTSVFDDVGHG